MTYLKKNVNDLSGFDAAVGIGITVTQADITAEVFAGHILPPSSPVLSILLPFA